MREMFFLNEMGQEILMMKLLNLRKASIELHVVSPGF